MSKFPCHMLGLCVKISHLRHKSHTQFLPPGAAIYVIFRLSRAPRNKLNQAMWGRGGGGMRREGRAGVRVEFLMLLLVKFWTVHLYRSTCRIICSGGAAPITTTEMKPRTIVFGKNTSSFEHAPLIITRIIQCCCQENICASYSGFWVQISASRRLILTNTSVIFWVSAHKSRNSALTEFVVLMEKRRKEKYSKRIKKERRDGNNWAGEIIQRWLPTNQLGKNNNKVYLLDTSHLSSFLQGSRYQKYYKWVKNM